MKSKSKTCADRILHALRFNERRVDDLARELFVDRRTLREHLARLVKDGWVHKKFAPHPVTSAPDYRYSSVAYPPRYMDARNETLDQLIGDWDALDITKVKR